MEDLFKTLQTFGENIFKVEINYKKDSPNRKTKEYFIKKISAFKDLYRKFVDIEKEIVKLDPNHELDYRASVLDKYEQFLRDIEKDQSDLAEPNLAANILG